MKIMPIAPGGAPSGSYAGLTASHNRYGYYLRARVVPTNPSTPRQQAQRTRLGALAQHWSNTLTAAQRAAWNLYGANITKVDALGNEYTAPGFNWYVGNNTIIDQCGGTRVDAGPTILTLPVTDPSFACVVSAATQDISVTFGSLAWYNEDGGYLAVWMTRPQSPGCGYIQGPTRFADSIDGNSTTPPTSPETVNVPYAVTAGQVLTVYARIVRADGRVSQIMKDSLIVSS